MRLDAESYAKTNRPLWLITVATDVVAVLIACKLAVLVRHLLGGSGYLVGRVAASILLYTVATVIVYLVAGLYSSRRFKPFSFEIKRILISNSLMFLLAMAWFFVFHLDHVSRIMLVFVWLFSNVLVSLERFVWRKVILRYRRRGLGLHRLLIVGGDFLARKFYDETVRAGKDLEHGFEYVGYLAPDESPDLPGYLGDDSRLRALLEEGRASEVVVTAEEGSHNTLGNVVAICGRFGAKVSVIPEFGKYLPMKSNIDVVGDLRMITLRSSPNANPGWNVLKRGMDIAGSVVGLVLGSPLMLYAAIAIKAASPDGPVIFKQTRCGRNGRPFTMYKFRTMVPDAESLREGLQDMNEAEGPVFKMQDDPRIIRHGAFLRKSSIDEMPQFLNVLLGSMSLVGPRPPLMSEVEQYEDWELGRLSVKPGLTCYWQTSGRSDVGFDEWMRMDLRYVADQSFATDVRILAKTVGVVLKGKGAR